MRQESITTNEWHDARYNKPWRNRLVLCRFEDGHLSVCKYNGLYWVGQHGSRLIAADEPTHFYIFENFNLNDVL